MIEKKNFLFFNNCSNSLQSNSIHLNSITSHNSHTTKGNARSVAEVVPRLPVFRSEPQAPGGERQSGTTVQPKAALRRTNEMCIHHGSGAVDPNAVGQASKGGLSHELAEMDSLPAQSGRPRLKRSPRRSATPQPLI